MFRVVLQGDAQVPPLLDRGAVRLNRDDGFQDWLPKSKFGVVVGHLQVHGANNTHAGATPTLRFIKVKMEV